MQLRFVVFFAGLVRDPTLPQSNTPQHSEPRKGAPPKGHQPKAPNYAKPAPLYAHPTTRQLKAQMCNNVCATPPIRVAHLRVARKVKRDKHKRSILCTVSLGYFGLCLVILFVFCFLDQCARTFFSLIRLWMDLRGTEALNKYE